MYFASVDLEPWSRYFVEESPFFSILQRMARQEYLTWFFCCFRLKEIQDGSNYCTVGSGQPETESTKEEYFAAG